MNKAEPVNISTRATFYYITMPDIYRTDFNSALIAPLGG